MSRFTTVLLGETVEFYDTDNYVQAIAKLHDGKEKYQRGHVVDNNACEICADFGYEEE